MKETELILELYRIIARYALVNVADDQLDQYTNEFCAHYLKKANYQLIAYRNLFNEKTVNSSAIGLNYGDPLNQVDARRIAEIAAELKKELSLPSQLIIPIMILPYLNMKGRSNHGTLEIIHYLNGKLANPEYAVENVFFLLGYSCNRIFGYPIMEWAISGKQVQKDDKAEADPQLKIIRASVSSLYALSQGNDEIFCGQLKMIPGRVYVIDEQHPIRIKKKEITFDELQAEYDQFCEGPVMHLQQTSTTPEVVLDATHGVISFKGKSVPVNAAAFYDPIRHWLDQYITKSPESVEVFFQLDYFGTSSSKYLLEIMKKVEIMHQAGTRVSLKWYHDRFDQDLREAGENFAEIIEVPLQIIQYETELRPE